MLPEDIVKKTGTRIIDQSMGTLTELLKRHAQYVSEIEDFANVLADAQIFENDEVIQHYQS